MKQYVVENFRVCCVEFVVLCLFCFFLFFFGFFCFFFGKERKKEEWVHKQKDKITDGLSEATGMYQKCLSNIHTEFLAYDGKLLSLMKVLHHFKG